MQAINHNLQKNCIEGYRIFSLGEHPVTSEDVDYISHELSPDVVDYEKSAEGEMARHAILCEFFRLRHPGSPEIVLPACYDKITNPTFTDFFLSYTGAKGCFIDRCQAHLYRKNNFVAKHVDKGDYLWTCILMLDESEGGGEMAIEYAGKDEVVSLTKGDLLILDSTLPHEVKPVTKGIRKTLCFLVREAPLVSASL